MLRHPVNRRLKVICSAAAVAVPLSLAVSLAGCAPEAYRRDADREVQRILRDRKQTTLGYEPQAVASDAPAPSAKKRDYQKIPVTAVPPPVEPAIVTPVIGSVPFEPMGPEFDPNAPAPGASDDARGMQSGDEEQVGPQTDADLAYGPPAPGKPVRRLDLFGALKYGVQSSREYQDKMEDLYLAALDVTLERHLFAPRPFARVGAEFTGAQGDVNYRSALAATASAGVKQQLPYGGEITAETLVKFVDALEGEAENAESADVVISGSIPLLRGAGLVNLEPLIASERQVVYAVRDFEAYRRSFAVDIASRYFGLLAQQQAIRNRLQNYATLASLLERARALFAARRLSGLDVQRAEQSLLAGENTLIDARLAYANALDNFKIALGMDVNEPLDVTPVQLEVAVPDLDGPRAVETAYEYRLELQTAEDRVGDAARRVEVARNGLLPDLNLTGRASTANRADEPARKLDSRTLEYSAGVQLDLPVDRVAERNTYRATLIGFDRAQRNLEETRDQVTAQVRADARGIRSAQSSLLIQRQSITLAERRLELATERLRLGVQGADTREVVEAQEDLLSAQDDFERAQANLQIQILEFLRDTGTLRVDPDAGELGQALFREKRALQAGTGMEMSK
jgi:outer membrane protein TolC